MIDRDRDEAGRARSSRPRDALGRPLPPGSAGIERVPDDLMLPPNETLVMAQELLDRGFAFNAHEVLEGAWKSCPDHERPLWQGLAQLAVGITHVQRGNAKGAALVLRRASPRIESFTDSVPYGIDIPGLVTYIADLIVEIETVGAEHISTERLRPRLADRRLKW